MESRQQELVEMAAPILEAVEEQELTLITPVEMVVPE
jgi:hypothetical protein